MPVYDDTFGAFVTKLAEYDETEKFVDPGEAAAAGMAVASSTLAKMLPPAFGMLDLGPEKREWRGTPSYDIARTSEFAEGFAEDRRSKKLLNLFDIRLPPRGDVTFTQHGLVEIPKAHEHELDYLQSISKSIDGMLTKYKLPQKGVKMDIGGGSIQNVFGPRYNILDKKIQLPWMGKEYALHEIGHAAHFAERGARASATVRNLLNKSAFIGIPMAYVAGDEIKKMFPGKIDDKAVDFVQKHAPAIAAATWTAAQVYPEVQATARAVNYVRETEGNAAARQTLKKLLGPLMSYVIPVIPAVVGLSLAKKYYFDAKKKDKKKGLKKKAGVKSWLTEMLTPTWEEIVRPVISDISFNVGNISHQTLDLIDHPINEVSKKLWDAGIKTVKSPEFVSGAIHAGVPTAALTYVYYNTPHGKTYLKRYSDIHKRNSDEVGRAREEYEYAKIKAKHDNVTLPVIAGAAAAVSGGFLSKLFMDIGRVL